VGRAGRPALCTGVWPWRSSETGTTRGQLRGRGKSWETGTLRGCLAPTVGCNSRASWVTGASWVTSRPGGAGQAGKLARLVRQAEQGPLHPIYGGGLVLLCPNRTPRQLTTRRQKVAVTNMLGSSAMTGNLTGGARPGNSLARRSRKRRNPVGQARDPVDQMRAGSTRDRPSSSRVGRTITAPRPQVPSRDYAA
jgi:hypothetical protein